MREYMILIQKERAEKEIDTLSKAPTNAYKGFSQQRNNKKPKKRQGTSLPRHLEEHKYAVSFGCGTLPSDNMNMIMHHDFEHAYVHKQVQRMAIEQEMQKIAEYQAKHSKHNIYLTKAQQLRNEATRASLDHNRNLQIEDAYLTENSVPKVAPLNSLLKRIGVKQSDAGLSQGTSLAKPISQAALSQIHGSTGLGKAASALPPVKESKNKNLTEQEAEIKQLIQQNLIFDNMPGGLKLKN